MANKRKNEDDISTHPSNAKSASKEVSKVLYESESVNGEYYVLIDLNLEKSDKNDKKRINDLRIYEILEQLNMVDGVKRIKRIGFRRSKILFSSAQAANKLVNNEDKFRPFFLRPFIPYGFAYKFGVIDDVPKNISEDKLMTKIESDIAIKYITRLTYADPDNRELRRNSNKVKIAFIGQNIPESITLFCSERKVNYFIQRPRQCNNCWRLGHLGKQCKAKKRCVKCGSDDKCQEGCGTNKVCLLCGKNDHLCSDKNICLKKKEQDDINRIMVIGNLSYNEAREKFSPQINPYAILTDVDYEVNFPSLPNKGPITKNNQIEINKEMRKHFTYNKITQQKIINIPPLVKYPQAEALKESDASIFSIPFEKVTEMEKIINQLLTGLSKTAENSNNQEIVSKILKIKQDFNSVSLLCDRDVINSTQNPVK